MKFFFLTLTLCFYFLGSQQAIGQKKEEISYSTILFQLRGSYPKNFSPEAFGRGNALEGQSLLKLEKLNDSTYYSAFLNPVISNYFLTLNKEYFSSYIEPNKTDTIKVVFDMNNKVKVEYYGDYKTLFLNSDQYAKIMKNIFFINKEVDTWSRKNFNLKNVNELVEYIRERTAKKNNYLYSIADDPMVRSVGKEVIDISEMTYAMGMTEVLTKDAMQENRFAFYRTIFQNRAGLFNMNRPMSEIVFRKLLNDSILNLPNIVEVGPYKYQDYLDKIFGNSLGKYRKDFFEHLIAVAYLEQLVGGRTFSPIQQFDILSYFDSNMYKTFLIRKSDLNSSVPISKNINYLPFDAKNDDVFNSIVSKYKNKVILIDYWATWCGPCITSFETIKPLKEKYKDNKDVIFLYLTDETSNYDLWKSYTEKLSGEHYYITEAQLKLIFERNKMNAIPHYMLVDRNGTIKYSETFPKELYKTLDSWIGSCL
ncbi:TlpA family protein disulfide reductase [Sphingobacterium humi]|uniref:Redoxin family protein n=1 Tax=Sphingobacterium humi TaxID=1796905 RepID=A0A6N8KY04_9SPHI|nr:TlpA disulfide reductase family protein [Sphingobacterium humi]MVZ61131.1 redoxin family protein [Sphingobacterium humi]